MTNYTFCRTLLVGLALSASMLSQVACATTIGDEHQAITLAAKAEQRSKGESAQQAVRAIRDEWANIKYGMAKSQQLPAFEALIKKAEKLSLEHPNDAAVALWHGTILSTYSSIKGGLGALPYLKEARAFLEKSISINPNIDMGLAHGVLGAIYYRVPGWPIAFGDKEKAKKYLETALQIGPQSIDNNFYYGDFLRDQGEYAQAKKFLMTAQSIEPRKDRLAADKGRLSEIAESLKKVEDKLN
jgi:tetratricopeptide (TPR) repeat protein